MAEFVELVKLVGSPFSLLVVVLIFGVMPGLVLRLLVLMYPADDLRRRELVAELYTLGRFDRLLFVGEQFETALFDGLGNRVAEARKKRNARSKKRNARSQTDESAQTEPAAEQQDRLVTEVAPLQEHPPSRPSIPPPGTVPSAEYWRSREESSDNPFPDFGNSLYGGYE